MGCPVPATVERGEVAGKNLQCGVPSNRVSKSICSGTVAKRFRDTHYERHTVGIGHWLKFRASSCVGLLYLGRVCEAAIHNSCHFFLESLCMQNTARFLTQDSSSKPINGGKQNMTYVRRAPPPQESSSTLLFVSVALVEKELARSGQRGRGFPPHDSPGASSGGCHWNTRRAKRRDGHPTTVGWVLLGRPRTKTDRSSSRILLEGPTSIRRSRRPRKE